jgi:hypothetical protein
MTPFSPKDHQGNALAPGADVPGWLAPGRQYNLGQVMKAIVVVAVILAVAVQRPDLLVFPVFGLFVLVLAAGLYGISRLPFRARLAIELATAGLLLGLSAWVWRPAFYIRQAERTEELVRLCAMMANLAGDERSRDLYHREAAEYARRALALRVRTMWYGLLRSVTKEDDTIMTERELILELGLLESLDWRERIAERMGILPRHRWP